MGGKKQIMNLDNREMYIKDRKYHTYYPFEMNNCKSANSIVNIVCNCADSIINLKNSYLRISGTVKKPEGAAIDTIHAVDGFIFGLFSEAKFILGTGVAESVRYSYFNSIFKSFLFHSKTQLRNSLAGFVSGRRESDVIDKDGCWEVIIPLNLIFDIANMKDFIYYTRLEIILQRCADDSNFARRQNKIKKGADNVSVEEVSTETCVVSFLKIGVTLEHISLESEATSKILNSIAKNVLQPFIFQKTSIFLYPNLTNVTRITVPLKTFSFKSLPHYIIVGFTRMTVNEWKYAFSDLTNNNCEQVTVYCNATAFPSDPWLVDLNKHETSQMYMNYMKLYQFYRENKHDHDVALSKSEFDSKFPLFIIPINAKLINPLSSSIDLSIEMQSNQSGFVNGSTAIFTMLYTEHFNFSILQSEILNVLE
jgi:hypothetical protein